jgi:hypothetical protein
MPLCGVFDLSSETYSRPYKYANSVLCRRFAHLPDEAGPFTLEGEDNRRF